MTEQPAKKTTKAAPAKKAAASKKAAPAKAATAPVVESPEEATKRRFQEALERKHGHGGRTQRGHGPDRQGLPAGNDKRRQTFRRKSGG